MCSPLGTVGEVSLVEPGVDQPRIEAKGAVVVGGYERGKPVFGDTAPGECPAHKRHGEIGGGFQCPVEGFDSRLIVFQHGAGHAEREEVGRTGVGTCDGLLIVVGHAEDFLHALGSAGERLAWREPYALADILPLVEVVEFAEIVGCRLK